MMIEEQEVTELLPGAADTQDIVDALETGTDEAPELDEEDPDEEEDAADETADEAEEGSADEEDDTAEEA